MFTYLCNKWFFIKLKKVKWVVDAIDYSKIPILNTDYTCYVLNDLEFLKKFDHKVPK